MSTLTRVIQGTISSNATTDLKDGGYAQFTVTSDTGAVANASIAAARLYISSFKSYAANYILNVHMNLTAVAAVAQTGTMSTNEEVHAETLALTNLQAGLLTYTANKIYLLVEALSGTGNKINFRNACQITLEIDYTLPPSKCGQPSAVTLSGSTSAGEAVTLTWGAGSNGTNNPISHYEVGRRKSADGSTAWGSLETVTTTKALSCSVLPPADYGHHYRYYVRAVGEAGTAYASDWAASAGTLQKTRPGLVAYTDATITAGQTPIKAVHMLELQTNINRLRQGLGLASYKFTAIVAGYTSLGGWADHIKEMRTAIDEMGISHETWLTITVNKPRADVMAQLRRVVAAV